MSYYLHQPDYGDKNNLREPPPGKRQIDFEIANFVTANGLPFEIVNSESFRQLISVLSPHLVLPTARTIETCANKLGNPSRPLVKYQKTMRALSATLNLTSVDNRLFLAFSIHHFNEDHERCNATYFRELILTRMDEKVLLTILRRAISSKFFAHVKLTNLVVPDPQIRSLIRDNSIVNRSLVCFFHYISTFVEKVLLIDDFSFGLQEVRNFVQSLTNDPEEYARFIRLQFTKGEKLDLPVLDNKNWESTEVFLTRCLFLHESFVQYSNRFRLSTYISHEVFLKLFELHRLLQQCVKQCRYLNFTPSSISQILPIIISLQTFIEDSDPKVQSTFSSVFSPLTDPSLSENYELATLLDPRFAYHSDLYNAEEWAEIEKKLIRRNGQVPFFQQELDQFRRMIVRHRPEEYYNPFTWWAINARHLKVLSVYATDHLACPAVAVDSDFYFGADGKFSHVCKSYGHQLLKTVLDAAGSRQRFRGRGASLILLHDRQVDQLNEIVARVVEKKRSSNRDELKPQSIRFANISLPHEKPDYISLGNGLPINTEPLYQNSCIEGTSSSNEDHLMKRPKPISKLYIPPSIWNKLFLRKRNRTCTLCCSLKEEAKLKNLTVANEKLMVMLGVTMRGDMTVVESSNFLARVQKTYICRLHLEEARDEILKTLVVQRAEEIHECSDKKIETVLDLAMKLGHPQIELDDLRKRIFCFVSKYYIEDNESNDKVKVEELEDEKFREDTANVDPEILPKTSRQPRKQVLEKDERDSTVKLIEQGRFDLPDLKTMPRILNWSGDHCCLCSIPENRHKMVRVPKSNPRMDRWLYALGEKFSKKLKPGDNFVCRAHFDSDSFSSKGRLLEGRLPNVEPEKVEVTYRIQGDHFLKLAEQKSNTEKDAQFDLEHDIKVEPEDYETEQQEESKPSESMLFKRECDEDESDQVLMKKSKLY